MILEARSEFALIGSLNSCKVEIGGFFRKQPSSARKYSTSTRHHGVTEITVCLTIGITIYGYFRKNISSTVTTVIQHGASWRMFSQAVSAKWNKSKIRKVDVAIGDVSRWYWKGGTATAEQFILEFADHRGNHNSVEWQDRSSSSSSFSISSSSCSNSSLSSSRKLTPSTCRRSHLYQQRF